MGFGKTTILQQPSFNDGSSSYLQTKVKTRVTSDCLPPDETTILHSESRKTTRLTHGTAEISLGYRLWDDCTDVLEELDCGDIEVSNYFTITETNQETIGYIAAYVVRIVKKCHSLCHLQRCSERSWSCSSPAPGMQPEMKKNSGRLLLASPAVIKVCTLAFIKAGTAVPMEKLFRLSVAAAG